MARIVCGHPGEQYYSGWLGLDLLFNFYLNSISIWALQLMLLSQPFFLLFCLSFAVIERLPGTTLLRALEQSRPRSRKQFDQVCSYCHATSSPIVRPSKSPFSIAFTASLHCPRCYIWPSYAIVKDLQTLRISLKGGEDRMDFLCPRLCLERR